MKILAIADHESKFIWNYCDPDFFKDIDLVISCGDLKTEYLSFVATMIPVPLLFVPGNHDEHFVDAPPGGGISIDHDIYLYKGIRILGLGGSFQYNMGTYQYTEKEMKKRIRKLKKKLHKYNGFDILVTHAPVYGIGDGKDLAHRGFQSFQTLMDQYQPSYLIHGHQHLSYNYKAKRIHYYKDTTIINAYEYHVLDYKNNGVKPIKDTSSPLLRLFHSKHIN